MPVHHAAASQVEELHGRLVFLPVEREDVQVGGSIGRHALRLGKLVDGPDHVPQVSRQFEPFPIGGFQHLAAQTLDELAPFPFHEPPEVPDPPGILLAAANRSHARSHAALDVVIEAHPGPLAVYFNGAGTDLEMTTHQFEDSGGQTGGKEGTEIEGPVALDAAGHQDAWKGLVDGQLDAGVGLVVPEEDVVLGLVSLDQVVLESQGLHLVVDDDALEIRDLRAQLVQLDVGVAGILEIASDPVAQRLGLAHVDDVAPAVLVEIHPRFGGKIGGLFFQGSHRDFPVHYATPPKRLESVGRPA